jgi:putative sigma-54 modulation protein
MMEIRIQSDGFDAKKHLLDFVNEGAEKLEKYYDKIQKVEVFLKLNPDPANNKSVGIRVHVPGTELYASKSCDTFEEAVDEVFDALRRQVKKHKEKLDAK